MITLIAVIVFSAFIATIVQYALFLEAFAKILNGLDMIVVAIQGYGTQGYGLPHEKEGE